MKKLGLIILLITFLFASCSLWKDKDKPKEDTQAISMTQDDQEEMDEDVFVVDDEEMDKSAEINEEEGEEVAVAETDEATEAAEEETAEPAEAAEVDEEGEEMEEAGTIEYYEVKKGDTLMIIAFSLYGDYGKWKDIFELNKDLLNNSTELEPGTKLKYQTPSQSFAWNPSGSPYLIIRGDTLGKISNKVYGKPRYWRYIWENNKPMIKNPSLIFAGFTIYYLPLSQLSMR